MTRWAIFAPVGALVVFAGFLGLRAGAVPSETEIINNYAAAYVAQMGAGAALTDCAATPHPDPAVRMVIACAHVSGVVTTYYVGPRGAALNAPKGPDI